MVFGFLSVYLVILERFLLCFKVCIFKFFYWSFLIVMFVVVVRFFGVWGKVEEFGGKVRWCVFRCVVLMFLRVVWVFFCF